MQFTFSADQTLFTTLCLKTLRRSSINVFISYDLPFTHFQLMFQKLSCRYLNFLNAKYWCTFYYPSVEIYFIHTGRYTITWNTVALKDGLFFFWGLVWWWIRTERVLNLWVNCRPLGRNGGDVLENAENVVFVLGWDIIWIHSIN